METFGEILEQSLAGGAVQQGEIVKGTVVAVDRDAVTIDIGFKAEGAITRVTVTYIVSGFAPGAGLAAIAPPVEGVLAEQLTRFKRFTETGKPSA